MWSHPCYHLTVASPFTYNFVHNLLKTQSFTLIPNESLHCIPIRKSPNALAWHGRLQSKFFPYQQTPLSSSHVYFQCCLYLDSHHSQIHLRPVDMTFSLCGGISCVFQPLPIVRKWPAFPHIEYTLLLWHCIILICFHDFFLAKWYPEARNFYHSIFDFEHLAQCVEWKTLNKASRGS